MEGRLKCPDRRCPWRFWPQINSVLEIPAVWDLWRMCLKPPTKPSWDIWKSKTRYRTSSLGLGANRPNSTRSPNRTRKWFWGTNICFCNDFGRSGAWRKEQQSETLKEGRKKESMNEWNGMEWNERRWNERKLIVISWNAMRWREINWN